MTVLAIHGSNFWEQQYCYYCGSAMICCGIEKRNYSISHLWEPNCAHDISIYISSFYTNARDYIEMDDHFQKHYAQLQFKELESIPKKKNVATKIKKILLMTDYPEFWKQRFCPQCASPLVSLPIESHCWGIIQKWFCKTNNCFFKINGNYSRSIYYRGYEEMSHYAKYYPDRTLRPPRYLSVNVAEFSCKWEGTQS